MKTKRDYLKIISWILMLIVSVFVVANMFLSDVGGIGLALSPSIDISKGWENLQTGEEETEKTVRVLPGATLSLSRELPENLNDDNVVGYYDYGFRVIAYVDNEEIYSAGWENHGKFGTQNSPDWKAIPLKAEDSGKTLTLIFENDTDSALRLNLSEMRISYASSEVVRSITTSGWALTITGICTLLTLMLLVFSFVLRRAGFKENCYRMLTLAALSMTVGFWSWANSSLGQLAFKNEAFGYKVSYIAYFMIPMFLGIFYEKILDESGRFFRVLNISYRMVLVGAYIMYLTDTVPIAQSVFLAHIYLFTELLTGTFYGILDFRRKRSRTNFWALIGQLVFLAISLIYIPLYYLRGEEHVFLYAGFAFVAFALCMILSQGVYLFRDLNAHRKELQYREKSKIDPLTGGNSFTGLSYRLAEIDFTGIESPWFVVMELTNFSSVNALFGWTSGTEMLRGIYNANQELLTEEDYQATAGEAEFLFLVPAEKNIEELSRCIQVRLQQYMKDNWQNAFLYPRFCATRVNPGNDLNKLLGCAKLAYSGQEAGTTRTTRVYYFDMACRDRAMKAQVMENELNRALKNQKMYLLIRPVYNVESQSLCRADTVIVWNDKAEDDMLGYEVIEGPEMKALKVRMNAMHFEKTLEYLAKHPELEKMPFSVKVLPDCLIDHSFWEVFLAVRDRLGVEMSAFDFELPMGLEGKAFPALQKTVLRLHEEGATVSIGGFDGSMNLMHLAKELQVDCVKFDSKLFQTASESNRELYTQIENLVKMLHEQGQKVCICGLTNREEIKTLKLIGVDFVQGDGLHLPVSEDAFVSLVNEEEGSAL